MNRFYRVLFLALTLPFLILADAETVTVDIDFDVVKCYEVAKTGDELRSCALQDFNVVEKHLNQTYADVLEYVKTGGSEDPLFQTDSSVVTQNRLENAEKAWLSYREAQCLFEGATMLGDPGEEIVVAGCLARLTKERVKLLTESLPKPELESSP